MNRKIKFFIICIVLSLFCLAAVSATDNSPVLGNGSSTDSEIVKETPIISVNSSNVYSTEPVGIYLTDSNNTPLSNKNITVKINNKDYPLSTKKNGVASLKLNLKPNTYTMKVIFAGDDNYSALSKNFKINVLKLDTSLTTVNNTVLKNNYFYVYLKDNFGNPIKSKTLTFNVNGQTYKATTDANGKAGIKITLNPDSKYKMKISFTGSDYYKAVSRTITLTVPATTSIVIGNNKLLTKGYLRIYLKSATLSAISKKSVVITIGNKTYTKTTNPEGVIIFAPNAGTGNLTITASFKGSSTVFGCYKTKIVNGVVGSVKSPLKEKIPLVNGVPDIDVMSGNYIMANKNTRYTLLKANYLETIKRDSHYLYLYNKLTKFVYFKTKDGSNLQHILVREKWNVIERAINTKVVKANKNGYWPSQITVSLHGKSYTYAQVRDEQNTGYTCGPTSCSMCSQFLKNYICESQFSKLAKTTVAYGSDTGLLKKALEKSNFKCSYFYKDKFSKAIDKLKEGACCLVFNTWHHYVAILDVSKDGKKVLVGNPSGDYDHGSHGIPTKWVTVDFMLGKFNDYNPYGLVVKLNYKLDKSTKTLLKNTYSSFGAGWTAQNTNERIPQIGK